VQVEDLFYNTPARLKFLKTTATELARSVEIVGALAAAYPEVAFRVLHGRQEVLSTPGTGDMLSALAAVWGRETARRMVPVRHDDQHLSVAGFVGVPDAARTGRTHQLFLVNGRPARNRSLTHALEHAFRTVTPESRFPVACLALRMDPGFVDVNVHPSKLEVKFTRDGDVHASVVGAVSRALGEHGIIPALATRHPVPFAAERASAPDAPRPVSPAAAEAAIRALAPLESVATARDQSRTAPIAPDETTSLSEQLRGFRVLGQAHLTFIVATTEDGVVFVDQHVAHERILYERLTTRRHERGIPVQPLAIPMTVAFGAAESALLADRIPDFRASGWEIETFGRDAFVVRAAPALIRPGNHEAILRDMVDELAHQTVARRLVVERDQVTIANACRLAVKAGDRLSVEEMEGLLAQLADTRNPHFCPHGRPAVVSVPITELERRFRR
jgi:DNA mismatch repair protein MutL